MESLQNFLNNEDKEAILQKIGSYLKTISFDTYPSPETVYDMLESISKVIISDEDNNGTVDHTQLINRDAIDQHPISAITGLIDALNSKLGTNLGSVNAGKWMVISNNGDVAFAPAPNTSEFNGPYNTVNDIPAPYDTNDLYLVGITSPYSIYAAINSSLIQIGKTDIDLSSYYTSLQTDTLLDSKVDKEAGKGLSSNDYTDEDKAVIDNFNGTLAGKVNNKVSGNVTPPDNRALFVYNGGVAENEDIVSNFSMPQMPTYTEVLFATPVDAVNVGDETDVSSDFTPELINIIKILYLRGYKNFRAKYAGVAINDFRFNASDRAGYDFYLRDGDDGYDGWYKLYFDLNTPRVLCVIAKVSGGPFTLLGFQYPNATWETGDQFVRRKDLLDGLTAKEDLANKDTAIPNNPATGHYPTTGAVKTYVDDLVSFVVESTNNELDNKLDKSGGTMTGALFLYGEPNTDNEAANKVYVDENFIPKTSIVNNLTDGGADDVASAETVRVLDQKINTLANRSQDRGVVHNAITSMSNTWGIDKTVPLVIANAGSSYTNGDALFVVAGADTNIDAIVIVKAVDGAGAITQIELSKQGDWEADYSGVHMLLGGTGTGAQIEITCIEEPASTLFDIPNPQPNDVAHVVSDEIHGNVPMDWMFADFNGDGIYNWVVLGAASYVRNFLSDPILSDELENNSVTTNKIENSAVTEPKIADNAVTTIKINNSAVVTSKIADGAVTNAKYANNSISGAKIVSQTITANNMAIGSVNDSIIGTRALTDATESSTLPSHGVYYALTDYLQLFRNCLKWLVGKFDVNSGHKHNGTDSSKISYNDLLNVPGSYSTTEINTGAKWVNGADIYSKTINVTNTGAFTEAYKTVCAVPSGATKIISGKYIGNDGYLLAGSWRINGSNIQLYCRTYSGQSPSASDYVVLYYLK